MPAPLGWRPHKLGKRGCRVTLAEAGAEAGGHVSRESALPNLNAWARVRDYRLGQIAPMVDVNLYLNSKFGAKEVLEFGADHVAHATGARWCRDGVGRHVRTPIPGAIFPHSLSPDDIMEGKRPNKGPVVVFDDDHYYMGSMMAELLAGRSR